MSDVICRIDGCDNPVRTRELCGAHYFRLLRHGDPLGGGPPRAARGSADAYLVGWAAAIDESAGIVRVPLGHRDEVAIVDLADLEAVSRFGWQLRGGYATTTGLRKEGRNITPMHDVLIDHPPDVTVDHINRDRLDNRRSNLRLATTAQQMTNRRLNNVSGFKGVSRRRDYWIARIMVDGKQRFLGRFDTAEDAARAFDAAAVIHHGDFAVLNFPGEVRC